MPFTHQALHRPSYHPSRKTDKCSIHMPTMVNFLLKCINRAASIASKGTLSHRITTKRYIRNNNNNSINNNKWHPINIRHHERVCIVYLLVRWCLLRPLMVNENPYTLCQAQSKNSKIPSRYSSSSYSTNDLTPAVTQIKSRQTRRIGRSQGQKDCRIGSSITKIKLIFDCIIY